MSEPNEWNNNLPERLIVVTRTRIRMEYHNDGINSHKYWGATLSENLNGPDTYVIATYGRISGYGLKGTTRSTTKVFHTRKKAEQFLVRKIREKFNKGYTDLGGDVKEHDGAIEVKKMKNEEEVIFYTHRILRM